MKTLIAIFSVGVAFGFLVAQATAAVRYFHARRAAERQRWQSISEVRAAWRAKASHERAAFERRPAREFQSFDEVMRRL